MNTNGDKKRKTVAVLFGGRSVEHEISIITGLQLIKAMDTVKYKPIPVYISPQGKWYSGEALYDKSFYRRMPGSLASVDEVTILPEPNIKGLTVRRPKTSGKAPYSMLSKTSESVIHVDIFLPAFHGTYGEDGCIQGLLELADVPYTGCNVLASALGMSKYHAKKLVESHGIPVLPGVVVKRESIEADYGNHLDFLRDQVLQHPGLEDFPLFVKPLNLGSSIGVAKVRNIEEFNSAIVLALKYDVGAIVELNFGSGWTWLVKKADGSVDIVNTGAAGNPLKTGEGKPLLTIDVWEHAYYIDYRNLRPKFVETFLASLANWDFASANFA